MGSEKGVSFLLSLTSLKTSSQMCPEVCRLGDSTSYQVADQSVVTIITALEEREGIEEEKVRGEDERVRERWENAASPEHSDPANLASLNYGPPLPH